MFLHPSHTKTTTPQAAQLMPQLSLKLQQQKQLLMMNTSCLSGGDKIPMATPTIFHPVAPSN
jgi:hypothetical protein